MYQGMVMFMRNIICIWKNTYNLTQYMDCLEHSASYLVTDGVDYWGEVELFCFLFR